MASLLMAPAALRPAAAPHAAQRPARRARLVTLASVADDARATHTAAEHLRTAGGKRMPEPCGMDPEVQAARLKLAPQSVQDFIMRWGHRDGINSAYQACPVSWEYALLESTDEVPGHHHETAAEAAFRELAEALPEVVGWDNPAERLAAAPPSVAAFIQRWGRREGIEAAAA